MNDDRVDLKVYDIPVEVKNKYISMAKLDYDNELWRVLEAGMEKLEDERDRKVPELEEKVDNLQKQIVFLKTKMEELESEDKKDDTSNGPKTFGDVKKEEDDEEILDRYDITQ